MEDPKCKNCGRPARAFKCPDCDEVMEKHNPEHECGPDRCMPMCPGCEEAEEKCECPEEQK